MLVEVFIGNTAQVVRCAKLLEAYKWPIVNTCFQDQDQDQSQI